MSKFSAEPFQITRVKELYKQETPDILAVEEPLEIRLGFGLEDSREQRNLAITMRTPGNDIELVIGFLFTEGIIESMIDLLRVERCTDSEGKLSDNVVRAELSPNVKMDWGKFQRHFYTNSSCGICGKASIDSLHELCESPLHDSFAVPTDIIHLLNQSMRDTQLVFEHTGGLHASALFNSSGELIYLREDIGRHNALDKVIGTALHEGLIPVKDSILMLSGRCCFELVQKAVRVACPILVAVGAPSNLAVKTAEEFGITLIGFARNNGFNIYSKPERIK